MLDKLSFSKIFIILSLFYFAFQAKPWASAAGNVYAGDDESYYGYASSIINDFDLDISNNEVWGNSGISPVTGKIFVQQAIGTSFFLAPFYLAAKPLVVLWQYLKGYPFDQRHPLFFLFMSSGIFLYAYLGGYFLFRALMALRFERWIAVMAVTLGMWGTILPAYMFKRPIFTHVPEFFLISLLLHLMVRWEFVNMRRVIVFSFLNGLLLVTRWNDIHLPIFTLAYIYCRDGFRFHLKKKMFFAVIFLLFIIGFFLCTQGMAWKISLGGYFSAPYSSGHLAMPEFFSFSTIKNFVHIFVGFDWGLVYTMLPLLLGFGGLFLCDRRQIMNICWLNRMMYVFLLFFPFIIILKWQKQACYFGYRYLLSLLPFSCVGLAYLLEKWYKKNLISIKNLIIFTIIILVFNFLLLLPFEYGDATTLKPGLCAMGGSGWVNNAYVVNAIKIYFTSSLKDLIGLFSRGYLTGYVFFVLYLFFPSVFVSIAAINGKIAEYYIIDSAGKVTTLAYPVVSLFLLYVANIFIRKRTKRPH